MSSILTKLICSGLTLATFSGSIAWAGVGTVTDQTPMVLTQDNVATFILIQPTSDGKRVFNQCTMVPNSANTCRVIGKADGYTDKQLHDRAQQISNDQMISAGIGTVAIVLGTIAGWKYGGSQALKTHIAADGTTFGNALPGGVVQGVWAAGGGAVGFAGTAAISFVVYGKTGLDGEGKAARVINQNARIAKVKDIVETESSLNKLLMGIK